MNCTACGKELASDRNFAATAATPSRLRSPYAPPAQPYAYQQRIVRPRYGRMIGGVCAGSRPALRLGRRAGPRPARRSRLLRLRHAHPRLLHRLDRHSQRALLLHHRALRPAYAPPAPHPRAEQ
jgi:hypothetical protein